MNETSSNGWLRPAVCLFAVLVAVVTLPPFARALSLQTPENPGEGGPPHQAVPEPFVRVCGKCHDATRIVQNRRLRIQWEEVVESMVQRGAKGSDQDLDAVMEYLVSEYGRANVNVDNADELAEVLHLDAKDASAVVDYRTTRGKFTDFDALLKVPGIPAETLRKYRDAVAF